MTSVGQIEIQLTYIVVFTLDAKKNKPRLLEFTFFLGNKKADFLKTRGIPLSLSARLGAILSFLEYQYC